MPFSLLTRFERRLFPGPATAIACAIIALTASILLPRLFEVNAAMRDGTGQLFGHDFALFWAAGELGHREGMSALWDIDRFNAALKVHFPAATFSPDTRFHYPPTILFPLAPLSALPLTLAFPIMIGTSIILLAIAMLRIIPDMRTILLMLGAPLVINALIYGQWSFLFAALMVFALIPVARGETAHPLATALFIMKPTLGLALPLAFLFVPGGWRKITIVLALIVALIVSNVLIFGVETWLSYLGALPESKKTLLEGLDTLAAHSATLGTVLQFNGVSPALARSCQWLFTIVILGVLAAIMRSGARGNLKAASLAAGTVLGAPYMMAYDFCLLLPAAAFFIRDGMMHGFRTGDRTIIAVVAIAAMFINKVQETSAVPFGFALSFGFFVLIATRARQSAAENKSGTQCDQEKADGMVPAQRLLQNEY